MKMNFDGVDVVSTTELCELLGLNVSSDYVCGLNMCAPYAKTKNGIYWRARDVPLIAGAIAERMCRRAYDLQIQQNIKLDEIFK